MTGITLLLVRTGFSAAFGAVGLYLLRAARTVARRRGALRRRGVAIEGRVVGHETRKRQSRAGGPTYDVAVIGFDTPAGESIRFTPSRLLRPTEYPVGRRLPVRYLAEDPASADVEPLPTAVAPILVLGAITALMFVIAALPWVLRA